MRPTRRQIPSFALFGEQPTPAALVEMVHIEDIPSRSRKYLGQISSHRHLNLCQCIVVTAGPVTVTLEGCQATYEGPIAVIVPAGTIHGFRFRDATRGFVLTVNLENLSSLVTPAHRASIESLFATPRAVDLQRSAGLAARTTGILECLLCEYRQAARLPDTVAGWLACSALWMVAEGANSKTAADLRGSAEVDLFREFRCLVEQHYTAHWAVERYARELGMSEPSLNRLCRRMTGSTGFDLVQRRVALEARRRLLYAGESVSMIASVLGFKDSAYFSRFFRRHSGVSPVEFRRRVGDGKVPIDRDFVHLG